MSRFLIARLLTAPALPALSADKEVPPNGACEVRIDGPKKVSICATFNDTR